ncbi:MAG: DUF2147 domain-containing protein [Candidatus Cloacimonadaceae bacterium]|nr:DUF2147 domain-containing protein [Candidatus Cloacimonadaceae bacterium]
MKTAILMIIAIAMLMPLALLAQKPDDITGVWYNGEKTSKIEVFKTTAGNYAGRIVWLKVPNDAAGIPRVDKDNPEASLRARPLMGLVVLTGLNVKANAKYDGGKIYDPKSGKTYSSKAEFDGIDNLKLRGYIGVSIVGRTDTWTRTTK